MLDLLAHYSEWIVGISAGLVLVVAAFRKVKAKGDYAVSRFNLGLETLVGRDEIRHPETQEVLVEATPPLGMRLARMEEAVIRMADTHTAIITLTGRVDEMGNTLNAHIAACPPTTPVVINQTAEIPKSN